MTFIVDRPNADRLERRRKIMSCPLRYPNLCYLQSNMNQYFGFGFLEIEYSVLNETSGGKVNWRRYKFWIEISKFGGWVGFYGPLRRAANNSIR